MKTTLRPNLKEVVFEIVRLFEIIQDIDDRSFHLQNDALRENRKYFQDNKANITKLDLDHNIAENIELRHEIESLRDDRDELVNEVNKLLEDGMDRDDISDFAELMACKAI